MREAFHVNDQQLYIIPQNLSNKEIENHKKIANKGSFKCPYCNTKLYVKSGPILGNYFSHYHGEACEPSKQSEARSRKYEQLKKNDSPRHSQILVAMYDELNKLSYVHTHFNCSLGYLDSNFSKYIPDISLKIHDKKYAITIVTNINNSLDYIKARNIRKQSEYYKKINYEPLFFIERNISSIDTDGQSLVLWQTEKEALTVQLADLSWQKFLKQLAPANELQHVFNILITELKVQSILYISPVDETITIEVFHIIEKTNTNPPKAYFFSQPYHLKFESAFRFIDGFLTLADMEIEQTNQLRYSEKFQEELVASLKEQERRKKLKFIYERY